jgi:hypothetical protein
MRTARCNGAQIPRRVFEHAMETKRLRKLQEPSQVERLLDTLISRSSLVPAGAYQIRDPASVPKELRRIATQANHRGQAWSCWAHSFRTWLFTGEMSLALSRERGTPVLQVDVYEDSGLRDSGPWMPDRDGSWRRCSE